MTVWSAGKKLKWRMSTGGVCRAGVSGWKQFVEEKICIYIHLGENCGRKGGRQGVDGLCVFTKTYAWKIVRRESV